MENQFKQIAALIGEPTRAAVLWNLLEGKAFTATELAIAADTSPQNMSMHLAKLINADLIVMESQGRHKYYKIARKEIAYAIEAMLNLIPHSVANQNIAKENIPAIKQCRTCYDHLAGKVGVLITDNLLKQKIILNRNNNFEISKKGTDWFSELDIDVDFLKEQRRSFLRPCLDWSERRYHMAGSLATALLNKMLANDWIRKTKNSRVIVVTSKGEKLFYEKFRLII